MKTRFKIMNAITRLSFEAWQAIGVGIICGIVAVMVFS